MSAAGALVAMPQSHVVPVVVATRQVQVPSAGFRIRSGGVSRVTRAIQLYGYLVNFAWPCVGQRYTLRALQRARAQPEPLPRPPNSSGCTAQTRAWLGAIDALKGS